MIMKLILVWESSSHVRGTHFSWLGGMDIQCCLYLLAISIGTYDRHIDYLLT